MCSHDHGEESGDPYVHMLAGSFAGIIEHFAVYPMDTIKTHVQTAATNDSVAAARHILELRGGLGFWRGVTMQVGFCGPAHALMFASYEQILRLGGAKQTGDSSSSSHGDHDCSDGGGGGGVVVASPSPERVAAVGMVAGAVSTCFHDLVMVPAETVKQRLQLGYYRGAWHCLSRMVASGDALGSLYRSLPTTLATNAPYGAILVATNESVKKVANPDGQYSLPVYVASGAFSGSVAGLLTTPLDVVKTRLQTQSLAVAVKTTAGATNGGGAGAGRLTGAAAGAAAAAGRGGGGGGGVGCCAVDPRGSPSFSVIYRGFFDALRSVWREEGYRGFARGAGPRVLIGGPAAAISWSAYETCKHALEG